MYDCDLTFEDLHDLTPEEEEELRIQEDLESLKREEAFDEMVNDMRLYNLFFCIRHGII